MLTYAIARKNLDAVWRLLSDPERWHNKPFLNLALVLASQYGVSFAVQRFLKSGVNPDSLVDGRAAIHHAVMNTNSAAVELLLQSGANVNLLTSGGNSALYIAAENNRP